MRRYLGICASIMLLSACSGSEPAAVGLSTRVGAAKGTASVPGQSAQQLTMSNGITVERIRLSVKELELKLEGDDDSTDDSNKADDHGGDNKHEQGPFLIDLSGAQLEGAVVQLHDVHVETGKYDEIEFDISKVSVDDVGDDAGLKELADKGASVIVDGTIDGQPFSFVSSLTVEQEREASFEISADGTQNVTINIDPSAWFTDAGGARLDPRESGSRSQIENNIKSSIDAFDDDDRNGGEDHDDDNGGDHHGGEDGED
ncbi:DUF4382 domain-containing protein [Pyxidicoccus parkwayensis]|uniref:DUF4382 domain-containing protein n=1 Tax=Pyxidicoccus parkwayensis TaxID=2813578 RepID=A0ABX7NXY1_9BACT|nr:DUF4382 domain-containing protein [Pyxidicoccus parkwaysis]QSQ23777.1 DUF4382 domain-containing protein [Pyxidicoccus parkwaysis]